MKWLQRRVSASFSIALLFAIPAVSAEPEAPLKHPELRRAILDRFSYTGQPRVPTPEEIRARRLEEAMASAEVVKMEPVIVRAESPRFTPDVESSLKNSRYGWKHHTTLGTGFHVKNFRKTQAVVVTVLYVPILVGFSW